MTRTIAIIPALNEQATLAATIAALRSDAPAIDVVVVNDGSTDATADVARQAGVALIDLPFNLGVGGALRAGFQWARDRGYDRAVQFDADGQHDARDVAALLAAIDDGAAMAVGSRFRSEHSRYVVGRARGLAMRLLRGVLMVLLKQRFTDTSSGFRAFNRSTIELFATEYPVEYLSDTVEALLLLGYRGARIDEVPVRMHARAGGVPSTRRFRLVYHYLRLLAVVAMTASLDGRRAAAARRRGSAA